MFYHQALVDHNISRFMIPYRTLSQQDGWEGKDISELYGYKVKGNNTLKIAFCGSEKLSQLFVFN